MIVKIYYFIFFNFLFISCGSLKKLIPSEKDQMLFPTISSSDEIVQDYTESLNYSSKIYIQNNKYNIIPLSHTSKKYLSHLIRRVIESNQLLFGSVPSHPQFYIIKDERPLYFSLPNGKFFISNSLLQYYIRHEGDLVSILVIEAIKSSRLLYKKGSVVPIGIVNTNYFIHINNLNLDARVLLGKWAYFALMRAEYDPYVYLSWIQQLNKNMDRFSYLHNNKKNLALEEYQYKAFFIENGGQVKNQMITKNSSKDFYKFISSFR